MKFSHLNETDYRRLMSVEYERLMTKYIIKTNNAKINLNKVKLNKQVKKKI